MTTIQLESFPLTKLSGSLVHNAQMPTETRHWTGCFTGSVSARLCRFPSPRRWHGRVLTVVYRFFHWTLSVRIRLSSITFTAVFNNLALTRNRPTEGWRRKKRRRSGGISTLHLSLFSNTHSIWSHSIWFISQKENIFQFQILSHSQSPPCTRHLQPMS